jgi:hypothetical protein
MHRGRSLGPVFQNIFTVGVVPEELKLLGVDADLAGKWRLGRVVPSLRVDLL